MINIMPNPGIKNDIPGPTFAKSYCALNYLGRLERRREVSPAGFYEVESAISYYKCF